MGGTRYSDKIHNMVRLHRIWLLYGHMLCINIALIEYYEDIPYAVRGSTKYIRPPIYINAGSMQGLFLELLIHVISRSDYNYLIQTG